MGEQRINQYVVQKKLGEGSFATVRLCEDTENQVKYAMKVMNKEKLKKMIINGEQNAYKCLKEELKVLKTLEHPNIIWLHEIIDNDKRKDIYLITEYHSKGSLGDLIKQNKTGVNSRLCK